jgi:hypothetical protein
MSTENLNEVKFRGSQYLIMDDIIKIIQPAFPSLSLSIFKKYFIESTVDWQHANNQPVGNVRLKDTEIRRKCVADILSGLEKKLIKEYKLDKTLLKKKIKEGMTHFEDIYMNRDDYC